MSTQAMLERRVVFDFEVDFRNGGGLQGRGFRLDIEGEDVSASALADSLVRDLGLPLDGDVRILRHAIVAEPHTRKRPAAKAAS